MARRVKVGKEGRVKAGTNDGAKRPAKPAAAAVVDLVQSHRDSYGAGREPQIVDLAPALFLAATGRGDPNGRDFGEAVGALYAAAYTIKFARRRVRTFKVAPLEGLWWGAAQTGDFTDDPRERWNWQALIRVPDDVTPAELEAARARLEAKGTPAAQRVTLERLHEGRVVQALHVGPYACERATIERLLAFALERKLRFSGRHHEIYLSGPRRTAASKLRTILRVPVRPVGRSAPCR